MSVLIVIPARHQSVRFPGKPLALLKGATGIAKPLLQRSWEVGQRVSGDPRVVVATDDAKIIETVANFGAEVIMTSEDCRNGTERVAQAYERMKSDADIVVNLQGDAPLTPPDFVEALIDAMVENPDIGVATPVLRCDGAALQGFREDRRNDRVGGTTAVFDDQGRAMYFSKEVIPFTDGTYAAGEDTPVFHHVGVYAFRPNTLAAYRTWAPGRLETLEGLEQIRFMENDVPVHCVEVPGKGRAFWEVNNPVDVARVETILKVQGIE